MGIQNLVSFLRKKFPSVFKPIHLSELAYKKVAIDVFYYICILKYRFGEKFLYHILRMISVLRKNDIHLVMVFDGKAPIDKNGEKKERREAKEKTKDKISEIETALEELSLNGTISEVLLEFQKKRKINDDTLFLKKNIVNVKGIEAEIKKMKQQMFQISPANIADMKQLLKLCNVPYIEAVEEAETTCASLCIDGKVDAVLSEDTDVLAYGTPVFLTKADFSESACMRIDYSELLTTLKMTSKQFRDFCILCGTDYNKNIPGVGIVGAYNYILKFEKIENITPSVDASILNYPRVRELFTPRHGSVSKIHYCGEPNFEEIREFLLLKNQGFDLSGIIQNFNKTLIFSEDNENGDHSSSSVVVVSVSSSFCET